MSGNNAVFTLKVQSLVNINVFIESLSSLLNFTFSFILYTCLAKAFGRTGLFFAARGIAGSQFPDFNLHVPL